MANLYGANYTNEFRNVPSQKANVGDISGRKRVLIDQYVAGALSNGDIIFLGKLPKGAKILNAYLSHDDLGSTGTAKLGWAASAEKDSTGTVLEAANDSGLIASIDLNAAANVPFMLENAPTTGMFKEFTAEVDIILTLTAATTVGGTINSCVEYVID